MTIDIPDEWIKRCLNADPSVSVEEALKYYFRERNNGLFEKHFIFSIGDYALTQMGKNLK